jgi:hypothetical protein
MEDYQNKKVKDLDPSERAYLWYDILAEYQKTQETKPAFLPVILRVEHLAGQVEALKSEVVGQDQRLEELSRQLLGSPQGSVLMYLAECKARAVATELRSSKVIEQNETLTRRVKALEEMHGTHFHQS